MSPQLADALDGAAATAVFAVVHSALASAAAKRAFAAAFGARARAGWYRALFIVVAVAQTAVLAWWLLARPPLWAWRVAGPGAWALVAAQVVGFAALVDTARRVGWAGLTGWRGLRAWWRGDRVVPLEAIAQGPEVDAMGPRVSGLFRWSRHPLNLVPLPIVWCQPLMTWAMVGAAAAATAYFAAGSWHEERRLLAAHGDRYRRYVIDGPGFWLPRPPRRRRPIAT